MAAGVRCRPEEFPQEMSPVPGDRLQVRQEEEDTSSEVWSEGAVTRRGSPVVTDPTSAKSTTLSMTITFMGTICSDLLNLNKSCNFKRNFGFRLYNGAEEGTNFSFLAQTLYDM